MHALIVAFGILNSVAFVALALVSVRQWSRRRDAAAGWLVLAFLSLGLVVSIGRLIPTHPHGLLERGAQRLAVELLVLFPFLLYRFATVFVPPSRRLQRLVGALTVVLSVWTFVLPRFPAVGEHWPGWFLAYVLAFLIHWTLLSVVVSVRLWRAGVDQPGVAASRMRLLSFASAAITVAIVGTVFQAGESSGEVVAAALAVASAAAYLAGLAPPSLLRTAWRSAEQSKLQEAIRGLMTVATTPEEVAARVFGPMTAIVGARAGAVLDGEGRVITSEGLDAAVLAEISAGALPKAPAGTEVVQVKQPGASLLVWTSAYAPFFGEDELAVLRTIAALTGIALDRVRLFEQEHESRLALERANELMTNFVALAAHELRTPVTTIHGFVQTLNHLGDRLDVVQQDELRAALEQQTTRMAALVEQLLDLSRLDADAVEFRPQKVDLRERLEEVVALAAGARRSEVAVEVIDDFDAVVDPAILDHIVVNLVTNAFRYGRPPVRVSAHSYDGHVYVLVEDAGPGVAHELEETLFERFTRAGVSRDLVAGTGLGLAIAHGYARAHRGDLRYERGQPTGSRFVVELPSG
ncbi:MAG: ATP-binding protein [Actinomycetota bacterium]|nr:ATP-binding protein [Actinomycetota bacterium]